MKDQANILVVDDEPEILRAVRSGLAAQGYAVQTATRGDEALRQATGSQPCYEVGRDCGHMT